MFLRKVRTHCQHTPSSRAIQCQQQICLFKAVLCCLSRMPPHCLPSLSPLIPSCAPYPEHTYAQTFRFPSHTARTRAHTARTHTHAPPPPTRTGAPLSVSRLVEADLAAVTAGGAVRLGAIRGLDVHVDTTHTTPNDTGSVTVRPFTVVYWLIFPLNPDCWHLYGTPCRQGRTQLDAVTLLPLFQVTSACGRAGTSAAREWR